MNRPRPRQAWIISLILALGTLAVFIPVLGNGFVNYDDGPYIYGNPMVKKGLTIGGVKWAFTTGTEGNWHPLTWLSHMLDCQLYGLKPAGHHLTNLLFHISNTLLLFACLRRVTGAVWRSAVVAALFAWHPLHVESVAWAAERKDVLGAFFWFLTMLVYAKYVEKTRARGPSRFRTRYYILALFCFALGLMSKPMVVTLPFVLLLMDYWPLHRVWHRGDEIGSGDESWKRLVLEKLPFFALSAVSSVVTYFVQQKGGAVVSMEKLPIAQRTLNALLSYGVYLRKLVWPSDLAIPYPFPRAFPVSQMAVVILLLLAATALAVLAARRRPWLTVGWLWFLGTLVPVLGLVQVGGQAMADRYAYLPVVGIFIALVWGGAEVLERWRLTRIGWMIAAPLLVACAVLTWRQAGYWKNDKTLFDHATRVTRNNFLAHSNLGQVFFDEGNYDAAKAHFLAALQISPGATPTLKILGVLSLRQGDPTRAAGYFELAVRRDPLDSIARFNLGVALAALGKHAEAANEYAAAAQLDPGSANVHYNHGIALFKLGRFNEAVEMFASASRLDPAFPEVHFWLGETFSRLGRVEEAAKSYHEALRLKPDWPTVLGTLAWLLATNPNPEIRNGPEAVRLAERACALLKQPDPRYLSALDAAYAECGRFDDAIKAAGQTLKAAVSSGQNIFVEETKVRLALYRAGKPYRE